VWKQVQAGTPSLNFWLTITTMLITWLVVAAVASKLGHSQFSRY
jgi:hypothetical protein